MKILKKIFLVVAILIAIPLIAALFIKNEYSVERQIVINKPKHQVFDYVKHIKNQDHYNVWSMKDPTATKEYKGVDGTVGFVASWDSGEVGKGEQTIKEIAEGQRIDLGLHFIKPFEGDAAAWMQTHAHSDNATTVSWGMSGRQRYPFNFMNLFINNMLGKDLEKSLATLKTVLEQQ